MTGIIILAILFFLMLNAFFAGSETALTSLNKIRLRHLVESKDKRAILVNDFLKEKRYFLGTTLVGTNISLIISTSLATYLFSFWFGKAAAAVSTIVMTVVILICCEIVPKTVFRSASDAISLKIILPLRLMFKMLYPIVYAITYITDLILKPFKDANQKETKPFLTKKDIEEILKTSYKKDVAAPDESTLIRRIFKLGMTTVDKIMIPLEHASMISEEDCIENLKELSRTTRFSRFPVYKKQKNNIIGIINIYDLLFSTSRQADLKSYIQTPYFINASERVDKILSQLRKKKKPMAIVINEEGRSIGIVTIEDLLEEIVGEIEG